ncbi:MAG TPA: glycosyltransferase family 4 protein [Anaerolineaceae bacterium]|nr:glycosyltransferase family 4 protein [Anaerolineaceae bacterium]
MTVFSGRTRIGLVPRLSGVGGPSSFNQKFSAGLASRGIEVTADLDDPALAAVLVNGGARRLDLLWRVRRQGIPLVQRLDGINWIHRRRFTSLRHFLRSEQNNWLLAFIRRRLATRIVYQSQFTRAWWQRLYGPISSPSSVVYNGVDLEMYHPSADQVSLPIWVDRDSQPAPEDAGATSHVRILVVEGRLRGGTELGLENAFRLAEALAATFPSELVVAGDVPARVRQSLAGRHPYVCLTWAGVVPREQIPSLDRSASLLYSAELNAPCPNSVIEALACGLPVAGYNTGSLPEIVRDGAGRLAEYGADPFSLDPPPIDGLAQAAQDLLANLETARKLARARAESAFSLDTMVDGYLEALLGI